MDFISMYSSELAGFLYRLIFDFIIIFLTAKIYFKDRRKKNILFALFLLNIVVFIVCFALQSIQLSLGFAFGIFALFSILRYRTTTVPIKEMTYIFISISIAIINALTILPSGLLILIISNIIILLAIYYFERKFSTDLGRKTIIYNNLELISPEKHDELIAELSSKTGLNIKKLKIGSINFLNNSVQVRIYYED